MTTSCGAADSGALPDAAKRSLQSAILTELEARVGRRLSQGLSDAELDEFSRIVDRDEATVTTWLASHRPGYREDIRFVALQASLDPAAPRLAAQAEYAAAEWLGTTRPDYRSVVESEFGTLMSEISDNAGLILASRGADPA